MPCSSTTIAVSPLSSEEQNALRYVAGYVIRKVLEHYKKNDGVSEESLLLYSFSGNEATGDATEMWTDALDRGGLWHVKDSTYALFYSLEEELRCHLQKIPLQTYSQTIQLRLMDTLIASEDVLFQWSLLGHEIDDVKGMTVLSKIVKLYVTTRGHAFASSCVELYKQYKKKTLQKRKALRTELYHD